MTKRWLATQPTITLAPPIRRQPDRHPHKLTATVTDGGAPVADVQVGFFEQPGSVNGNLLPGEHRRLSLRDVTDANGQATCTYTGSHRRHRHDPRLRRHQQRLRPTTPASRATRRPSAGARPPATSLDAHAGRRDQHRRHPAAALTRRPTTTPGPPATRPSASRSRAPTRRRDRSRDRTPAASPSSATRAPTPGTDTITAFVDNDDNGTRDAGEPQRAP